MNPTDEELFWSNQRSSLHRADDPMFYARKAIEHAGLMSEKERSGPCLDLGCGAGELLEHLEKYVKVASGLDYSESMLDAARNRLGKSPIRLIKADLFEYLPGSTEVTWMTTGAINQYLDLTATHRFLKCFNDNTSARSLFLFDCVDPVRYAMLPFGLSYLPPRTNNRGRIKSMLWPAYLHARSALVGAKLALGLLASPKAKLGSPGMGYGFTPAQWRLILKSFGLQCEILSSLFYEYRFHVIVRK